MSQQAGIETTTTALPTPLCRLARARMSQVGRESSMVLSKKKTQLVMTWACKSASPPHPTFSKTPTYFTTKLAYNISGNELFSSFDG